MKSILLHRPTPWESEVTCSTKVLSRYFKEDGFQVSYMETPMDPLHIVKWKGYFHVWNKSPRQEDGVWVINPFSPIPTRDIFPLNNQYVMDASYRLCIPSIASLLNRGGIKSPDVVWAARPGGAVFKKIFPRAKLIMQVVDYYPAFRGEYIKKIERRDYAAADHIFLIGHAMRDYVIGELGVNANKVTVLGQGVSLGRYDENTPCPNDIRHIHGPLAVWVGVLEKADVLMFEQVAREFKEIGGSLILIGKGSSWAKTLQTKYGNVYLLGSKKPEAVPAYLLHSDIGLMLYDRSRSSVYYGQNPLKLYEYAAAGLGIISTPHREFDFLDPPLIEVRNEEDVSTAIHKLLAERDVWRDKAIAFSKGYAWQAVYGQAKLKILDILE